MFCKQLIRSARFVRHDVKVIAKRNLVVASSLRANAPATVSNGTGKYIASAFAAAGTSFYSSTPVSCAPNSSTAAPAGPDFKLTDSGLRYRDLSVGTGPSPEKGDEVSVHYTGWLQGFDAEEFKFDSSYDRSAPLDFNVGVQQVIQGWDEALLTDMKVGTKREVIIPPDLGYGRHGAGRVIPPGATLYFRMELVAIKEKSDEKPAA